MSELVTLDGVMEAPGGEPGHPHNGWVRDFMRPEQHVRGRHLMNGDPASIRSPANLLAR